MWNGYGSGSYFPKDGCRRTVEVQRVFGLVWFGFLPCTWMVQCYQVDSTAGQLCKMLRCNELGGVGAGDSQAYGRDKMAKVWCPPPGIHENIQTIPTQTERVEVDSNSKLGMESCQNYLGGYYKVGQESRKILEERRLSEVGWGNIQRKLGNVRTLLWLQYQRVRSLSIESNL